MVKKVFKYLYLVIGVIYYILVNYLSFNVEPYKSTQILSYKIFFTTLSLILLIIIYLMILIPKIFTKEDFTLNTKIALYVGVLIVPLISLTS